MEYLSKTISQKPKPYSKEFATDKRKSLIRLASDVYFKIDKSGKGWVSWTIGSFFLLLASIGFLLDDSQPLTQAIYMLIFGLPGVFVIVYGLLGPRKEMIYNRIQGTITVTRVFRKSVEIPFDQGFGVRVQSNTSPGVISSQLTFVSSKKKPRVGGVLSQVSVEEFWSFTVWYMDKNRPLPPGTAFDEFRDKDFERRKKEGFPRPLYPSAIQTPEATPEQQAERKKIGGW